MSNTILIVEAADPVPWTKPQDLKFDPAGPLPKLGLPNAIGFNASFADGSVRYLRKNANEQLLRAAITRAGGEPIDVNQLEAR